MRVSRSFSKSLTLALAAGAVVVLAWLSIPRTIAALVAVPGDRAMFAVTYDPPASDEALQILIDSRLAASQWIDDPIYDREIAMASSILARRAGVRTEKGRNLLLTAERHAEAALAMAPADPETWLRLAEARHLTDAPTDATLAAFRNSILTGANSPFIASRRIRLGFALWPRLSGGDRQLVTAQVRSLAATGRRRDMDRIARLSDSKRNYTLIVLALLQRPDWLAMFKERRLALEIQPPVS